MISTCPKCSSRLVKENLDPDTIKKRGYNRWRCPKCRDKWYKQRTRSRPE